MSAGYRSIALILSAFAIAACGSKSTSNDDKNVVVDPPADSAKQVGQIIDFDTKKPVVGATIVAADQTVTTDATGAYAFTMKKGQPFAMVVTAPKYAKLIEQETTLDADFDKGKTSLVSDGTATLLLGALDGHDDTRGVLSVQLIPTGACASEEGAKVTVTPADGAKVKYVYHGLPSAKLDAVGAGEFPSAIIYNVKPGVALTVGVEHPTCKLAAFPVTHEGVAYTGGMTTEPGNATSFARLFLE